LNALSNLKAKIPLKIHCWGGFGSQLNALGFALELTKRFQNRRIILVFHTGGVTRRDVEIQDLIPCSFSWEIVDDYVDNLNFSTNIRKTRKFLSKILLFLRIIVTPSENSDFVKIKPWTFSARGHYAQIRLSPSVLSELALGLGLSEVGHHDTPLVVHYRLGDLLALEKGFTESDEICKVAHRFGRSGWLVLTDSPAEASGKLRKNTLNVKFDRFLNLSPKEVIQVGFSSEIFIGTTSKISIWIAIFRISANRGLTFLPYEMQEATSGILPIDKSYGLKFYP